MATVKFYLQTKSEISTIYLRFSVNRDAFFRVKTKYKTDFNDWNSKLGLPKNIQSGTIEKKNKLAELTKDLSELKTFVLDKFNKTNADDVIDKGWLVGVVDEKINGRKVIELDYLDNYLNHYLDEVLPFRKINGKLISIATDEKQKQVIEKLFEFIKLQEKSTKRKIKVSDYDVQMSDKFDKFMQKKGLSRNTIGRLIKYPKTILKHALTLGIPLHPTLAEVKGYSVAVKSPFITIEELQLIKDLKLTERLDVVRDWFIIGFHTGQRVSDFAMMCKEQLVTINGKLCINLIQQKTNKMVAIPLHDDVIEVLDKRTGEFPPTLSKNVGSATTIFNENLKRITEIAEIDRLVEGKVYNSETKLNEVGNYPLYRVISSHICRRSFATHYYTKIPTPVIRAITGHSNDSEFLKYIGLTDTELAMQMADYWHNVKEKPTPQTSSLQKIK